jgi:hypothetical protein
MSNTPKKSHLSIKNAFEKLIEEWHPSKNEKPITEYAKFSQYKAWWLCSVCKHEWQATLCNRTHSKCPKCRNEKRKGSNSPVWTGYAEISGRQWHSIKKEATESRRNRRYTKPRPPLEFTITVEYIWNLFLKQNRKCALSGEPLTMWYKINGKNEGNASLDRIDSSKGYNEENVQWIDKKLQRIKTSLSDADFIAICQKVAAHQVEKLGIPSFKKWATKTKSKTKTVS